MSQMLEMYKNRRNLFGRITATQIECNRNKVEEKRINFFDPFEAVSHFTRFVTFRCAQFRAAGNIDFKIQHKYLCYSLSLKLQPKKNLIFIEAEVKYEKKKKIIRKLIALSMKPDRRSCNGKSNLFLPIKFL